MSYWSYFGLNLKKSMRRGNLSVVCKENEKGLKVIQIPQNSPTKGAHRSIYGAAKTYHLSLKSKEYVCLTYIIFELMWFESNAMDKNG